MCRNRRTTQIYQPPSTRRQQRLLRERPPCKVNQPPPSADIFFRFSLFQRARRKSRFMAVTGLLLEQNFPVQSANNHKVVDEAFR
jgi:hypothetical protein